MLEKLKESGRRVRGEVEICRGVMRDRRTPWISRILLALAVGYILMPFDLIPDFIQVIGHLDDLVIVPALILLALRMVPDEVIDEHREAPGGRD